MRNYEHNWIYEEIDNLSKEIEDVLNLNKIIALKLKISTIEKT